MTSPKQDASKAGGSRKERAGETRRRMLEAAYRLFSEQGYTNTTLKAVALEARVAVQTVYFTFHSKPELLQATYHYAVVELADTPPHLSDWWRAAEAEPDVVKALRMIVGGTLNVFARAAPLVWAVHGDDHARTTYEFNEQLRIDGYTAMVTFLARKRPLRMHLTERRARDILLTILGPHVYVLFTHQLAWSPEDYGAWAHAAALRELFAIDIAAS
jgi:AcrR family transcriptional regulator